MALHDKKAALAAVALAIGALVPAAGTASAYNYGLIRNGDNARCLDATWEDIGQNGTNVQLWNCHSGHNQLWILTDDGRIHTAVNQRCLDAAADELHQNGTNVQLWDCHGRANQKWHYDPEERTLRNEASGRCLDATLEEINDNGTNVQLWDCHGNANQRWYF